MKNFVSILKNYLSSNRASVFLMLSLNSSAIQLNAQTQTEPFASSGSFFVPAGVTTVDVDAWGAGGGGSSASTAAGGGGGGAYTKGTFSSLSAGSSITVTVGTGGGVGAPTVAPGNFSRATYGANSITANGGLATATRTGGVGGAASATGGVVTASYKGGDGGDARNSTVLSNNEAGGGGGGSGITTGAADGANGSNSTTTATAGGAGTATGGVGACADGNPDAAAGGVPGAGGGGRGEGTSTSKSGGNGQVTIKWTCSGISVTNLSTAASAACVNGTSTITVSSTTLATGTYTVYYTLSGVNTASAQAATLNFTAGSPGTGTFATSTLASPGLTTTVTILSIGCMKPSAGNTANFTVRAKPTSAISGTQAICNGATSSNLSVALTGTQPWSITYTDGTTPVTVNGITSAPYTFTVSPSSNTTYTVSNASDNYCTAETADKTGSAIVTVRTRPTADITGAQTICPSTTSSNISIALTGTQPWSVTYTNGTTPVTVNGISATPYNFTVNIASAKTYTVSALSDTYCSAQAGDLSGSAAVSLYDSPTSTVTRISHEGPQFSGAYVECIVTAGAGTPPYTYAWAATNPSTSYTLTPSTGGNVTTFGTTVTNTLAYNVNPFPFLTTVTCTVTDANGCVAAGSQTSNIHPEIQAPVGSIYVCQGTASSNYTTTMGTMPYNSACDFSDGYCSYEWEIESVPSGSTVGSISSTGTPNNTATVTWDPGFYGVARIKVRAIGSGASGKTQNSNFRYTDVTITTSPTAAISGTEIICNGSSTSGLSIALTGTSPWSITYTDGTTPTTVNNITANPYHPTISPLATSTYTVSALSDAACAAVLGDLNGSGTVTVIDRPASVISGTQTICTGYTSSNLSISLTGASPWNLTYTDGTTPVTVSGITSSPYTFTVSPSSTKTYTVSALSDANCTSQAGDRTGSAVVTTNPLPTASAGGTSTICHTGTATISGASSANGTILWTHNGAGSITADATTLTPTYTAAAADANTTVTLTMTVTSNNACSPATASATYSVIVKGTPTAAAGGTSTTCQSSTATVSGASSSNGTIAWTHNGSGSLSNATTLTPTYTAAAGDAALTRTLTMTVSNGSCPNATATYSVIVKAMPTAGAGGSKTICQNAIALVSGASSSGGTILWTHNGNGTLTNATTLTPTYAAVAADAETTVTLTLSVTNAPCVATATYSVIVKGVPTATAGGTSTICQNGTATVSGATATNGTIAWGENGSGSITLGGTTLTPTYTAAAGDAQTTRTLTMTVSNTTCPSNPATATYSVIVKGTPTATITGTTSTICQTGNVALASTSTNGTILWTHNGNGSFNNTAINAPTYTPVAADAGNTVTLTMTVSNSPCAAASDNYSLIVKASPTATAGGTSTICQNGTATVSGATSSNGTILWADNSTWGSDGDITSGSTTLTPTYTAASGDGQRTVTLTLTVSNSPCAAATATYSVIVKGTPSTANAGVDQISSATCGLSTVTLAATAPTTGVGAWTITSGTGGSFSDTTNRLSTFTGVSGNTYSLRWTVSNSPCTASTDNMTVRLNPLPVVSMVADYCYGGGFVQVIGTSSITPATYRWNTGPTTQSILVDIAGTYVVTASVTATGCTATGTMSVAQELVVNGNFSSGVTGFTTDPQYANQQSYSTGAGNNGSGLWNEGLYAVNTNAYYNSSTSPQGYHPLFYGKDHTTGTGNFMMVNGSAPANGVLSNVWQQGPITVLPNTDYYFSAWGMSLNNYPPYATLRFSVNGVQAGTTLALTTGPATNGAWNSTYWKRFYGVWNSGSDTTALVTIVDLQTAAGGNDFGLDDISFGTLSTFVTLTSAVGTNNQEVCANSPITDIVYSVGSGAAGPTISGLPTGVTTTFNGILLTLKGTPTVAGTYNYTVTTTGNCNPATATGTIVVNPLPVPAISFTETSGTAGNDGIICKLDTTSLTVTPSSGMNYSWSGAGGTADNIIVSPSSTTSYTVTVTDTTTACSATKTASVTVNLLPMPTMSYAETSGTVNNDGTICRGASVVLTAGPASMNYSWAAPISATGNGKTVSAAGSYAVTVSNSNACSATIAANVTVNPLPTQTTVLADCMFTDSLHITTSVDSNIILVSVSGGTAPYTFVEPSTDRFRFSISSTQKAYSAPANNVSHLYTVKDALNCSSPTSVTTSNGNPTSIPYTSTTGFESANCYVTNFNKWLTFRDTSNHAIVSVNDNNQDLGVVSVTVYKDSAEPQILQTGTGSNCQGFYSTALQRHFVVTSTAAQPFTKDVKVRLFFTDAELQSLVTASYANNAPSGVPGNCRNVDDVLTINDLYVTKYDDPNSGHATVDGDFTNNLTSAAGGIYKVYGNATSLPTQPTGSLTKKQSGFSTYFSGGQTHHYVQLSVREFSEFWLHGSNNATALPVEMLYLQAEAVNNDHIQLTWATALEVNNHGFHIERTSDGQNWLQIGWMEGNNNTTQQTDYSFSDANVVPGTRYYYRLKQVDYDGQFEYTDVVTATIRGEVIMAVKDFIPNPAKDKTTLIITSTNEQKLTVDIYDVLGQKVLSDTRQLNRGANNIEFDTQNLASGTYTAIVSGNEIYTKKLVVAK